MTRLEQIRFNRLVRLSVQRFVDHDLFTRDGEPHKLLVSALALLGGFSFTLCVLTVLRYALRSDRLTPEQLYWAVAGDQLLLVTLVMAGAGLFAVLGWDGLFPDRRDAFILGALPVRTATLFQSRLYALILWFLLLLAALELLPLLAVPVVLSPHHILAGALAQLVALTAAAAAIYFGVLLLQGLLLLLLPYERFLQVSSYCQLLVLLSSLSLVFLTPSPAAAARRHLDWAQLLPAYWFLDLWRALLSLDPVLGPRRAPFVAAATLLLIAAALLLFAALYRHVLRKAVEGQALAAHGSSLLLRLLAATLLRNPRHRAIFLFTARSLARLRTHRLVLALYLALGLAWVLAGLARLLESGLPESGWAPSALTVSIPLDLALFCLLGLRLLFTIPVELPANWLFQLTTAGPRRPLERPTRLFLFLAGVLPMALLPLPLLALVWTPQQLALHIWFYLLETALFSEMLLAAFDKIPFTCSWLPGKSNLQVRLGAFLLAFGATTSFLAHLAAHLLNHPGPNGTVVLSALLLGALFAFRRQAAHHRLYQPFLRFEDHPLPVIDSLQLAP